MNPEDENHFSEELSPVSGANRFGSWMTVSEAVTYCSSKGLNRTPKTIRKWALRSHKDTEGADLLVRREDIDNGFRWSIERESLDRKIAQEKDFELRKQRELIQTGLHMSRPEQPGSHRRFSAETEENPEEQVHTSAERSTEVNPRFTGSDNPSKNDPDARLIETLKEHISKQDEQILFYREELRDRRTSTKALAEVIQAFRLNAENQSHRHSGSTRHHDVRSSRQTDEGDSGSSTNSHSEV